MSLTQEQFEQRVSTYAAQARAAPARYRSRVFLFALCGYAYLGAIVLLLFGAALAALVSVVYLKALAIKLVVVVLAFIGLVLRSMYVPIKPPVGIALTRKQSPELFEHIDRLRVALRAPRFHRVLVTDAFNAAVMQVPQLGVFGWHRNYLILGLPLLKCLTPEQLDAVLAHEFGHLAGGHARFSNWLYRLRAIWSQLLAELEHTRSQGAFLFKNFFEWYVPRFNAYSFPLARADEYAADAISARLTSAQAAAQALTAVNVVGSYLNERYWPSIHRNADDQPQPAFAPYSQLGGDLAAALNTEDCQRWLDAALARQTTLDDTHPCLRERLASLDVAAQLAPPQTGEAADHLLGPVREEIARSFDQRWQDQIIHDWRQRYEQVQEGKKRLAELDAQAAEALLPFDLALERANLQESFGSGDPLEQFRDLLQRAPDRAVAHYALGLRLLRRKDAEGVVMMEQAMQLDGEAIAPGCVALRDYYWNLGDKATAEHWHARLQERNALLAAAQAERNHVLVTDTFEPHGLPASELALLQTELAQIGDLRGAFLVRKRLQHFPERPCYVLGFAIGWAWPSRRQEKVAAMLGRLRGLSHYPGETLIISVEGSNSSFAPKLRQVEQAKIA